MPFQCLSKNQISLGAETFVPEEEIVGSNEEEEAEDCVTSSNEEDGNVTGGEREGGENASKPYSCKICGDDRRFIQVLGLVKHNKEVYLLT